MADEQKESKEQGEKAPKARPKGGRKGGAQFPHVSLDKALAYAKKLVSKTHTGPLPASSILPGVFDSSGSRGSIRAAALKQYGLLEGPPTAYKASSLARSIDAATPTEQVELFKQALLRPKVFRQLFETFQNDTVSRAKIEQRVKGLDVHPDSALECTRLFIASLLTAQLASVDGDNVILKTTALSTQPETSGETEEIDDVSDEEPYDEQTDQQEDVTPSDSASSAQDTQKGKKPAKANLNLTLSVDSTSDPEKLAKQLRLLRQFGLV